MKTKWFKRMGWFYVPVSIPGAILWLLAAIFCVTVFTAVDRHSHSVSRYSLWSVPILRLYVPDARLDRRKDERAGVLTRRSRQQSPRPRKLAKSVSPRVVGTIRPLRTLEFLCGAR